MADFALDGRVVVVTGGAGLLGREYGRTLVHAGAHVVLADISATGADAAAATMGEGRGTAVGLGVDVTAEDSVIGLVRKVVNRFGRIDGLVNNAGLHGEGRSHQLPTAEYERVMATNATAAFACAREAYPHLVRAGGGIIVNIGSYFDKIGVKRHLAYCASKAAVGAMTRCLAVEWADKGIRVVDVAPGYIETDLNRHAFEAGPLRAFLAKRIPGGRHGTADDVARLVAALCGEDLQFLTGETIYIDGGQGIAH